MPLRFDFWGHNPKRILKEEKVIRLFFVFFLTHLESSKKKEQLWQALHVTKTSNRLTPADQNVILKPETVRRIPLLLARSSFKGSSKNLASKEEASEHKTRAALKLQISLCFKPNVGLAQAPAPVGGGYGEPAWWYAYTQDVINSTHCQFPLSTCKITRSQTTYKRRFSFF